MVIKLVITFQDNKAIKLSIISYAGTRLVSSGITIAKL